MNVGACMLGAILGLIVGAMPGIGSLAGVALLLPLTYKFNPATAIIMLGALYYSNMYGGQFQCDSFKYSGRFAGQYVLRWMDIRWQQKENVRVRRF